MRRREFIALLGGTALAWPLDARAQQPTKPVIGFLNTSKPNPPMLEEFRIGLAENAYYEGQNVLIEYRWAEGRYDRLPALAAELVRKRVDVIVAAGGSNAATAAKAATSTIPIVVLIGGDPVELGLAASFGRPGGNVTGVAQLVVAAEQKRLELIHELVPTAKTIAYLVNPAGPNAKKQIEDAVSQEHALGVKLSVLNASSDGDFDAAFATVAQDRIGALTVGADPFFFMQRDQLTALSMRHAVPTMYFFREFVTAGGLISYGTRLVEGYHQLGVYTGKVLKGAKPADMPITQQSEKIELVINLKTAKALGLDVPLSLLTRADELIE
jgi:putative tryptophan/tyrosine transport system substrate-binding protein